MTNEALRIGAVVLFAPVALLLKGGVELGVALAAFLFGNTVLGTPPARMVVRATGVFVTVVVMGRFGHRSRPRLAGWFRGRILAATGKHGHEGGDSGGQQQ